MALLRLLGRRRADRLGDEAERGELPPCGRAAARGSAGRDRAAGEADHGAGACRRRCRSDADDQALLDQVVGVLSPDLEAGAGGAGLSEGARLDHPEADRRLQARLSPTARWGCACRRRPARPGAELRARLERIGLYRDTGHEHFNGSLVMPVLDEEGHVTEIYGRKITERSAAGTPKHLYLPGPHRGVWNLAGIAASGGEIILRRGADRRADLLVRGLPQRHGLLWRRGLHRGSSGGVPPHDIRRVLIAFDRDEAGERGAARVAEHADGGRDRVLPHPVPEGHGCQRLCAEGDAGRQIARAC